MSLRRFAGYFFVLAACATIAFSASDAETGSPPISAAELGSPYFLGYPHGSFSGHRHKLVVKRSQMAEAQ